MIVQNINMTCVFAPRRLATGPIIKCTSCQLVVTSEFSVWLLNTTAEPVTLKPGELCGFGAGPFEDMATGACVCACY